MVLDGFSPGSRGIGLQLQTIRNASSLKNPNRPEIKPFSKIYVFAIQFFNSFFKWLGWETEVTTLNGQNQKIHYFSKSSFDDWLNYHQVFMDPLAPTLEEKVNSISRMIKDVDAENIRNKQLFENIQSFFRELNELQIEKAIHIQSDLLWLAEIRKLHPHLSYSWDSVQDHIDVIKIMNKLHAAQFDLAKFRHELLERYFIHYLDQKKIVKEFVIFLKEYRINDHFLESAKLENDQILFQICIHYPIPEKPIKTYKYFNLVDEMLDLIKKEKDFLQFPYKSFERMCQAILRKEVKKISFEQAQKLIEQAEIWYRTLKSITFFTSAWDSLIANLTSEQKDLHVRLLSFCERKKNNEPISDALLLKLYNFQSFFPDMKNEIEERAKELKSELLGKEKGNVFSEILRRFHEKFKDALKPFKEHPQLIQDFLKTDLLPIEKKIIEFFEPHYASTREQMGDGYWVALDKIYKYVNFHDQFQLQGVCVSLETKFSQFLATKKR